MSVGIAPGTAVGELLRGWRGRRRLSQLELAGRAGVSPRHVSFVETGRSRPTRTMLLRLCDELDVPLREQNRVLLAGGFSPEHPVADLGARAWPRCTTLSSGCWPPTRPTRPWSWTTPGTWSRPTTRCTPC